MALTRQIAIAKTAALGAVGILALLGAQAPALAQSAFGQEMPQQFFLNRFTNPQPAPAPEGRSSPGGAAQAAAGGQAQAANADDDDGPGPWPKRFLLNRILDSARGPEPTAPAPAPAAK